MLWFWFQNKYICSQNTIFLVLPFVIHLISFTSTEVEQKALTVKLAFVYNQLIIVTAVLLFLVNKCKMLQIAILK